MANLDLKAFQSTLPARGATTPPAAAARSCTYFNPRSPHGERRIPSVAHTSSNTFQSTLPARGATISRRFGFPRRLISIHAPRTGSDAGASRVRARGSDFNPRSPHGERRAGGGVFRRALIISIHAPRTGSDLFVPAFHPPRPISIHAPRTGSDLVVAAHQPLHVISIHAPRTGSDLAGKRGEETSILFQSTLPARGATSFAQRLQGSLGISIHAPRTGSDEMSSSHHASSSIFQSTLPARGATSAVLFMQNKTVISIHAPRTGSDTTTRTFFKQP